MRGVATGGVAVTTTLSESAEDAIQDVMSLSPNSSTGGVPNYMTTFLVYSAANHGPPKRSMIALPGCSSVCSTVSLVGVGAR